MVNNTAARQLTRRAWTTDAQTGVKVFESRDDFPEEKCIVLSNVMFITAAMHACICLDIDKSGVTRLLCTL